MWLAAAGIFIGLVLWICGIRSVFGETSYLSILANPVCAILSLSAGFALLVELRERPTRDIDPLRRLGFFCNGACGFALIGLGISGTIAAFPAGLLVSAGLALLALSVRTFSSSAGPSR